MRIERRWLWIALAGAAVTAMAASPALAQARHPFAVGGQEAAPGAATGFVGLVLAWQNKFHSELQTAARALKTDGSAFFVLAAASFAYGVFHAAGPGHGKAVLASYMLANETALKRGLLLAGLAALLQGLVAIGVVGAAAAIFHATAPQMNDAARLIELASYAAIAALGARLVFVKGRALAAALDAPLDHAAFGRNRPNADNVIGSKNLERALREKPDSTFSQRALAAAPVARGGFVCEAIDDPSHVHDANCVHAIDPETLAGPKFRWADAAATVIAAGLRPCSGAILVLVFTLSQGLFAAGAAAVMAMSAGTAITTGALAATAVYAKGAVLRFGTKDSRRALVLARGAELLAALLVLALGLALLFGLGFAPSAAA
ncbi:high frequency lysogenization protein HflD [Methylocystis sp. 9N]|uniref:Nickel/cobalt efflux system n=1 Tax=Methylocystis borbori TaxID=3118750 RepID=A0ABU7XM81_9HYPH